MKIITSSMKVLNCKTFVQFRFLITFLFFEKNKNTFCSLFSRIFSFILFSKTENSINQWLQFILNKCMTFIHLLYLKIEFSFFFNILSNLFYSLLKFVCKCEVRKLERRKIGRIGKKKEENSTII